MKKPKRILIVTGEASGDQHAAKLVTESLKIDPSIQFFGMGGDNMRHVGVDIIVDNKALAVVGAVEVIRHTLPLFRAWRTLQRAIKDQPPDLIVLIDYPGFNLRLASAAKKAGIKVLYYISPQVWAWKRRRVFKIRQCVDHMLVIFPFEEEIYRQASVSVTYVGHPLAGEVKPDMTHKAARLHFQIPEHARVIGLLPGSRKGEIGRLLPTLLQSAHQLANKYPDLVFILPLATSLSEKDIHPFLPPAGSLPLRIVKGQFYNAMQLCDAAIVTSGTATLEVALLNIPMVIIYKTAAITYHIAKYLIKIPYIGLANIVAGRRIVPELIQHEAEPARIVDEISLILDQPEYNNEMRQELEKVKDKLGAGSGSKQAATALIKLLESVKKTET